MAISWSAKSDFASNYVVCASTKGTEGCGFRSIVLS